MADEPKYNILIVDDNPFPTRECCAVLLDKFAKYSKLSKQGIDYNQIKFKCFYSNSYDDFQKSYLQVMGKSEKFDFQNGITLTIYIYDPTKTKEDNQNCVLEIINRKSDKINIFWTDRGHSHFCLKEDKMYEIEHEYNTNADKLYGNDKIVAALTTNMVRQIAMYSYNPDFTYRKIEETRKNIQDKFKDNLNIDDVYVLETSPILNLFSPEDKLSNGLPQAQFLGTLKAFGYYGKLLGSVLFDLFLQLEENKAKLSETEKRYNFFNRYNRSFLRYFKRLNSDLINKKSVRGFKVGLVSFWGEIYGNKHYIIDVPYKEYYKTYDKKLGEKINVNGVDTTIGSIIKLDANTSVEDSERWLYFKYKQKADGNFVGYCDLKEKNKQDIAKYYLPLLHSGIFYEPSFYKKDGSFSALDFNIVDENEFSSTEGSNCTEVIYLFKKVNKDNFDGIAMEGEPHLAVWRHTSLECPELTSDETLQETIENIWEDYYRLVEPKMEASIVTILQNETAKQATRAAISQVMARNMSHNIGSHVLANILSGTVAEKHAKILLYYLKLRQEFLADISTSSAAVNFSHNLYEDILSKFCPVTDGEKGTAGSNGSCFYMENNKPTGNYTLNYPLYVLDNISGKSNLKKEQIKFCYNFLDNKLSVECDDASYIRTVQNDVSIDIPNDILGFQALYILLENMFRNSAKHSKCSKLHYNFTLTDNKEFPDYYKVEINDNLGAENCDKRNAESCWIERINGYIYNSILDNNKLRDGGWGMLEMKICAAYLVSFPLEYLDSYNHQTKDAGVEIDGKKYPPLLKASLDSSCNLCYTFYLRKPKSALVIDKSERDRKVSALETNEYKNKGIYTGTQAGWENNGREHRFLVLKNGESGFDVEKYEQETNQDVLVVEDGFLDGISPETFLDKVWIEKLKGCSTPIHFVNGSSSNDISGIVFDDHGQWRMKDSNNLKNLTYYEPYSSQSATNQILKADYYKRKANNGLPFQSIESQIRDAAHTGIIVVDERIQLATNEEETLDSNGLKKYKQEILSGMGIYLPVSTKEKKKNSEDEKENNNSNLLNGLKPLNLAESDFDNDMCVKWINHFLAEKQNVKYLVIHLGIIEKLSGSTDPQKILDWICKKEWLDKNNKSKDFRIVVTSGRGLPSNLPDGVLYAPISSIQQYIVNYRSKLMLVKLLKSIRKIYKNK